MFHETYSEYHANCAKCGKEVLEVIEYVDIQHWDNRCGICPKCKKLFCGDCVTEKGWDEIFCPQCGGEVIAFYDCHVYDLIAVIQNNFQLFKEVTA